MNLTQLYSEHLENYLLDQHIPKSQYDIIRIPDIHSKKNTYYLDKANDYKNTLIDKLRKHDLAKLSMKKPGMMEKRINNGTKKLFRSLESLTGATPPAPVVK